MLTRIPTTQFNFSSVLVSLKLLLHKCLVQGKLKCAAFNWGPSTDVLTTALKLAQNSSVHVNLGNHFRACKRLYSLRHSPVATSFLVCLFHKMWYILTYHNDLMSPTSNITPCTDPPQKDI